MRINYPIILLTILILLNSGNAYTQSNSAKKYPSLFWEITGNGLQKPSYLFGTMHVSNKMVFHLSDSFYYAMKNVDAVALELNPELWQGQMVNLERLKQNYVNFMQPAGGDFLTEHSFSINNFDSELKAALSTEPTVVNSLLYRSYKARADFEEDTFLDLYIFQTGKKLGKRATGVENYYETEKVVLEAYADMAKEKKKKTFDTDGESFKDIGQKIQDAYRRGDLDLMDSLDLMTERSDAFREKFLYKRNEIQAQSIDTIIKKSSLFVGVGAAHLAGPRGIIELLRTMGYKLRPITMLNRDAVKKEATDQLKVPVNFSQVQSEDSLYSVSMPGPLFKMKDENHGFDRRQYADMSNGAYYLVTRVKTYGAFLGLSESVVLKKVDSLLYENIPGRMLTRKLIQKNGLKGYDITNKTRRGDLQRYNIFVTPFEVLVFKMSGKANYVDGKEANQFFSSIQFNTRKSGPVLFTPKQGGFSINLPQAPDENLNTNTTDEINRWEYQSTDNTTGDGYLIFKKSINNFKFLDTDSFDLNLIEESFRSSDFFDKQLQRKTGSWLGYPTLDVKELMKDGTVINARYIIQGPHYYLLAVHTENKRKDFSNFFKSFRLKPYRYSNTTQYVDTFFHFSVTTPVVPELDESYRAKLEKVTAEISNSNNYNSYSSYWPKSRNALFTSDSTGETVGVSIQQYPKYYTVKDSSKFWSKEITDYYDETDMVLANKDSFKNENGVQSYRFSLRDTGSSRVINRMVMLKDNYMFSIVSMSDTIQQATNFIKQFYSSFNVANKTLGKDIFTDDLDHFFADLFSKDSTTQANAQKIISNIYYGEKGVSRIITAINNLPPGKDYINNKIKLIAELGYIKDSTTNVIVPYLKKIYDQVGDTSIFQNEVMKALGRQKSSNAIQLFKELLIQDPPIFENSYDYTNMFLNLTDSLELAATLYPELMQFASVDDYKEPVLKLLVTLVDSGLIKAPQLESNFNKLYFDAKIALKKQQGKDEKKIGEEADDDNENEPARIYATNDASNELNDYAILMMPFYQLHNNVPKFFDKLLKSSDENIRLNASILLLRNNKPVADSILYWFAEKDQWRSNLYKQLEKIGQLNRFPEKYKTQLDISRSLLLSDKNYSSVDSVDFIEKYPGQHKDEKGFVYFFKYRLKKDSDWKIGISGLQPENLQQISSDNKFVEMTDKKIKMDRPLEEQLLEQLKHLQFTFHKSAKNFYESENNSSRYKIDTDD